MEKLANFLVSLFLAFWHKLEARKKDQEHAAAVRADPGSHWLRRFGGKDARGENAAGADNAERHSN